MTNRGPEFKDSKLDLTTYKTMEAHGIPEHTGFIKWKKTPQAYIVRLD